MDALIRLDVLMPIAPLTDNSANIRMPTTDRPNCINSQLTSVDDDNIIKLDEMPDLIDLTALQGEGLSLPHGDNETATRPIQRSHPQVHILDDENVELSGANNKIPTKHKLVPAPLGNHTPSKVARTADDLSFAQNSKGNPQIFSKPTTSHELSNNIIGLGLPSSSIMRNHTVTSADIDNGLVGTSDKTQTFRSNTNRVNAPGNLSELSLAHKELNNIQNNVLPQNLNLCIPNENVTQTKPIQEHIIGIENSFGPRENKEEESAMFDQLRDMFPDIDLIFLRSHCRIGLDINQVTDIILEMNGYPKAKSQPSSDIRPMLTPADMVNVDVIDLSIPTNCSSSTTCPTLAENDAKLANEKNKNDTFSLSAVSDPTSVIVPNPTKPNFNQGSTSHVSGLTENENSLTSRNSKNTIEGILADKDPKLVVKEENNSLDKRDKTKPDKIDQFNFLMEIFPDADPTFMETKSKLNKNDLRMFIQEGMENNDYPKVSVPVKEEKEVADESSEVGLYTTNFHLGKFIKIFPDPFGYFLDEKRNCQYSEHGFEFLKRRYRSHPVRIISYKYKELKYNLVKTCEFLDGEKPSLCTKRAINKIKMPDGTNLPFLQEACFIEHKAEIKKHIDDIAEVKRLAYEQAEIKGELIECGCCYQNVLFEDCATCNEGHLFCKACVQKSVEVRIGEGHTTFPCLQDCGSVFSLQLLEVLIDATLFSRLLQRIQLDEVKAADIEGLEVCPFCDFAIILPPETSIFSCLNPECLKESCRKCHKPNHIPQRCEELENDDQARARKYIEDEMTRALVRVCYKCKKSFIKTDGCNKMTCTCGAKMCYICRQPIVDYKHFNGPGGDQKQLCPLYSTEKLLHVDAVEAVAKKALEEVNAKNPELKLKHDPTKILPAAESAKNTLPPGVNEERDRLINVLQNMQQLNERLQQGQEAAPLPLLPVYPQDMGAMYVVARAPIAHHNAQNNPQVADHQIRIQYYQHQLNLAQHVGNPNRLHNQYGRVPPNRGNQPH